MPPRPFHPRLALVGVVALATACIASGPIDPPRGGAPDAGQGAPDGGLPADCTSTKLAGTWSSPFFFADTEARYESGLTMAGALRLDFARFTDQFVGTFPLGPAGADGVPGSCSHCVSIEGDGISLFAQGGTLTMELDPFTRRLKGSLKGAWFREVADPPPAHPMCAVLEDVTFDQAVPSTEWTCAREAWLDGATCDCACGVYDPDCDDARRPTTCEGGRVCAVGNPPNRSPFDPWTSECLEPCDDKPCSAGTCVPWWDLKHVCVLDGTRFHDAKLGESCPPPNGRYIFCDVVDGVARGMCNYDAASPTENACHPLCTSPGSTCDDTHQCVGAFFELDGDPEIGPDDPFVGTCEPRVP